MSKKKDTRSWKQQAIDRIHAEFSRAYDDLSPGDFFEVLEAAEKEIEKLKAEWRKENEEDD